MKKIEGLINIWIVHGAFYNEFTCNRTPDIGFFSLFSFRCLGRSCNQKKPNFQNGFYTLKKRDEKEFTDSSYGHKESLS